MNIALSELSEQGAYRWEDNEAPLIDAFRVDRAHIRNRARRVWAPILALSVLLTLVPGYILWVKPRLAKASITISLIPQNGLGFSAREVRSYVDVALLSRERLERIVEGDVPVLGTDPASKLLRASRVAAEADDLREYIEVDAFTRFEPSDFLGDQIPAARVRLAVIHRDYAVANDVAKHLVSELLAEESVRRKSLRTRTEGIFSQRETWIEEELARHSRRIATSVEDQLRATRRGDTATANEARLDRMAAEQSLAHLRGLQENWQRDDGRAELAMSLADLEPSDLSIVDFAPALPPDLSNGAKALLTLVAFLIIVAAMTALVTAYGRRINNDLDLLRLGIPVMATVLETELRSYLDAKYEIMHKEMRPHER